MDFGIKVVISTSFADIFYNNCFKNGILPIIVSTEDRDNLLDDAEKGSNARFTVNLEMQEIKRPDGSIMAFDIDPFKKQCLLDGLDDIALSLEKEKLIDEFERGKISQTMGIIEHESKFINIASDGIGPEVMERFKDS